MQSNKKRHFADYLLFETQKKENRNESFYHTSYLTFKVTH